MSNLFDEALKAEGVTGSLAKLARSIYAQESGGGKNTQTSNAGARGGMQIIPSTFASVADKDWSIDDPSHNARAGIRYLKQLDKSSGGDPALTAAGYYGGPGGMEKAKRGIAVSDPRNPNAPNTLQYGQQVVARMGEVPSKGHAPATAIAANSGGAPQVGLSSGPAALSPEFLAALAVKAPAVSSQAEQDAWIDFLKAMPQSKRPVQVAEIDYGNQGLQVPEFRPAAVPVNALPNFAAFTGFGKRTA